MKKKGLIKGIVIVTTMLLSSCSLLPTGLYSNDNNNGAESASARHIHEWGEYETTVEPSCANPGEQQRRCLTCGEVQSKPLSALGHLYGDLIVTQEAQVGRDGRGYRVCSRCGHEAQETIPALVPEFTVTNFSLEKDISLSLVSLVIQGTCRYYTSETFKWAIGLYDRNSGVYIYGSPEPDKADFNIPAEIDNNGNFVVRFVVSDVFTDGSLAGNYNIHAGPSDHYSTFSNTDLQPGNFADNVMNYYFRNDQDIGSVITLCCDELPPYFHLADAGITFDGNDLWANISGAALDQSLSVEQLQDQMYNVYPFIQFQSANNNYYQPDESCGIYYNYSTSGFYYYFNVESRGGVKYVSLNMRINFMIGTGTVYNTHLNLQNSNKQANCVMENDFSYSYSFYSETYGEFAIEIFSHPAGSNTVDNSYGNLGIRLNNYHA